MIHLDTFGNFFIPQKVMFDQFDFDQFDVFASFCPDFKVSNWQFFWKVITLQPKPVFSSNKKNFSGSLKLSSICCQMVNGPFFTTGQKPSVQLFFINKTIREECSTVVQLLAPKVLLDYLRPIITIHPSHPSVRHISLNELNRPDLSRLSVTSDDYQWLPVTSKD